MNKFISALLFIISLGRLGGFYWMGWGFDFKVRGRGYVTVVFPRRDGDLKWVSRLRAHFSPNGTPWHHGAKVLWPLSRFLNRCETDCVCDECLPHRKLAIDDGWRS